MSPRSLESWAAIQRLRAARPRRQLVRWSAFALILLAAYAWTSASLGADGQRFFSERRLANLERFVTQEALPLPLRTADAGTLSSWLARLWTERGADAVLRTLWIALVAMALAALTAAALAPFATRTLMRRDPYLASSAGAAETTGRTWSWACTAMRIAFVGLRAIPEYVWAFLLLAVFGPSTWPAILALAIHNAGILGRLTSESLESLDPRPMRALRMLGAGRTQIAWTALRPLGLGRFLLFFFYRLETCVREATVLGMLGVVSLGYWVQDARARQLYDELLFFVALGGGLVLIIDAASGLARAWIRRAT